MDKKDRKAGMPSLSDMSLVVLNYQCEGDTVFCVERLLSFGSDFHIIVVDNLSPDGSYERLKARLGGRPCVDVLQSERNGGIAMGITTACAMPSSATAARCWASSTPM